MPCFIEPRSPFPPSTTTQWLSYAPYHGLDFHSVGFWGHTPWVEHPGCRWKKLRTSQLWKLGCWSTGLLGPRRWWDAWQLCLLPEEQPWTSVSPCDAETPGRSNWGGCFLAGSFVVCAWEEVNVNIFFFFSFCYSFSPPPAPLLHNLSSASACFLILVFVWASAAVIRPRQGLTKTNACACRHKNPQCVVPQDECCGFHALELCLYVRAALLTDAKVPRVRDRHLLIGNWKSAWIVITYVKRQADLHTGKSSLSIISRANTQAPAFPLHVSTNKVSTYTQSIKVPKRSVKPG